MCSTVQYIISKEHCTIKMLEIICKINLVTLVFKFFKKLSQNTPDPGISEMLSVFLCFQKYRRIFIAQKKQTTFRNYYNLEYYHIMVLRIIFIKEG